MRYYAFGYVLDALRLVNNAAAHTFLTCLLDSRPHNRCRPRDTSIPRDADPLRELAYGLNVRRYTTTNYDLEIERFLHDMGFRPPSILAGAELSAADVAIRVDQMGARARDFVLSERTVVEMLDFATDDNTYAFELVHLHGRSTADESIVVTERDYQETYMRAGGFHRAFNEAREAAFGGNPISSLALE
jgi:hypothetical protein